MKLRVYLKLKLQTYLNIVFALEHTKGSRPEWCISCSRDTPFWSETLDIISGLFSIDQGI